MLSIAAKDVCVRTQRLKTYYCKIVIHFNFEPRNELFIVTQWFELL